MDSDNFLSRQYEELRLTNAEISDIEQICVEDGLIRERFYRSIVNANNFSITADKNDQDSSFEKIDVIYKQMNMIFRAVKDFTESLEEVDLDLSKSAFIARFIARNIQILKRQLKSTYNKLPWEEIEFCLSRFAFLSTLERKNLQGHLDNFANELRTVFKYSDDLNDNNIKRMKDEIKKYINKGIQRNREKVSGFESLYSDYELIKDPYSLSKMLHYIELALLVSPEEQSARLVIERALQVIGEYLKGSPQSPHLSDSIQVTLIRMKMAVIIEIAPSLRNLLSHNNNLDRLFSRNSIEKEEGFFTKIQGDLKKIQGVMTQIFYNVKIRHYEKWCKDIISNDDSKIVQELSDEFIKKIDLEKTELMDTETHDTDVFKKIESLLGEMRKIIDSLCTINLEVKDKNEKLFIKIESIIASEKNKITYVRTTYNARLQTIRDIVIIIKQSADKDSVNYFKETKEKYRGILNMIRTEEPRAHLLEIVYLIKEISNNIKGHNIYEKILKLTTDINYIIYLQSIRANEIEAFKEKLGTLEIDTSVQEYRVKSELDDVLSTFQCKVKNEEKYRKLKSALEKRKQIYRTKLKLIGHFEGKNKLTQEEYNLSVKGLDETEGKQTELFNYFKFKSDKGKNLMKKSQDHYGNFLKREQDLNKLLKSLELQPNHVTLLKSNFDEKKLLHKYYTPESLLDDIINNIEVNEQVKLTGAEYNKLIKNLEDKKQAHKAKQELIDFFENNSEITAIEYGQLVDKLDTTPTNKVELNKLYSSLSKAILAVESLNDSYGAFIKAVAKKETTINAIYNSFNKFSESLQLESDSQELLRKIFKEKRIKILEDYFSEKLSLLKKRLENVNCDSKYKLILHYKNNKTLQAEVEMLLLDLSDISLNIDQPPLRCLGEEFPSLDGDFPFLMGVSLRNYLAHGDALIDSLPFDPLIAVISNALIFTKEGESIIALWNLVKDSKMKEYLINKVNDDVVDKLREEKLPIELQQYAESIITLKRSDYWIDYLKSMLSDKGKCNRPIVMSDVASRYEKNLKLISSRNEVNEEVMQRAQEALEYCPERGNEIYVKDCKMWTPLHIAAHKDHEAENILLDLAALSGNDQDVEILLNIGAEVNAKNTDGFTPLHNAALYGHKKVVEILLSNDAEINSVGRDGTIPLHLAAFNGNMDIIKLLAEEENVNTKDKDGDTPLHFVAVATHNKAEVVEHLLRKGAIIDSKDNKKRTPLYAAANVGNKDIVKTLLDKGAYVDSICENDYTPLHIAAMNGHDQVVEVLLNSRANVNAKCENGRVPLHYAASSINSKTTEHLLNNGAKVDIRTNHGLIPLHLATNNLEVVESLIQESDINTVDNYNRTPLHFAVKQNNLNVIRFLVNNGANVHASDESGQKPLHYWRGDQYSDVDIVGYLVDQGVDLNTPRSDGRTLLHLVAVAGYLSAAEYIVGKKARVDVHDNNDMTPLHLAALNGNLNVVEFLVKNGADVNAPDINKCTSLHCAAKSGNNEVVNFLLNKGAKIDAKDKDDETGLIIAAGEGHIKVVKTFLEEKKNTNIVDVSNKYKKTPLHAAACGGYKNIVKTLLENEASLNIQDIGGMTPLHFAAFHGNLGVNTSLVGKGANVDALDNNELTPLHYAIGRGHKDVIKILLKNRTNINVDDSERNTPLHDAAFSCHEKVVEGQLYSRAEVNAKDRHGFTPLHTAAHHGHKEVVEILLSNGAEINSEGRNGTIPLHFAASNGNMDVIKLLANEENVNVKDKNGDTPLTFAAAAVHNKAEVVEYLLEKSAIIDSEDNKERSPLYVAAYMGNKDIVETLLNNKADVHSISKYKYTPLHIAAIKGHDQVVEVLLNSGANVNAKCENGYVPLHYAILSANSKTIEHLLKKDIKVNIKSNNDVTLLHLAALNGNLNLVEFFVKNGADVNAQDTDGDRPLHYAAWKGYVEITEVLLKNKANPNVAGKNGNMLLHYVAQYGKFEIVQLLLDHGADPNILDKNGKTALALVERKSAQDSENGNLKTIKDLLSSATDESKS